MCLLCSCHNSKVLSTHIQCHIRHSNIGLAVDCASQIISQESVYLNCELKNGHGVFSKKTSFTDRIDGLLPEIEQEEKKILIDILSIIFNSEDYCLKICFALSYLSELTRLLRCFMLNSISDDNMRKSIWNTSTSLVQKTLHKELSRISINTFKLDPEEWENVINRSDTSLSSAKSQQLPVYVKPICQ